jgi:hypothetical protein
MTPAIALMFVSKTMRPFKREVVKSSSRSHEQADGGLKLDT